MTAKAVVEEYEDAESSFLKSNFTTKVVVQETGTTERDTVLVRNLSALTGGSNQGFPPRKISVNHHLN